MIQLSDIQIVEIVYQSIYTTVYRGWHHKLEKPVILKTLTSEFPPLQSMAKLKHEAKILKQLNFEGTPQFLDLQQHKNILVLVINDISAESLAIQLKTAPLTLNSFLPIAIQITDILGKLHQKHVIHKDINPSNLVLNQETQQLQIIDFGNSMLLPKETIQFHSPNRIDGTLFYISPEQTGRMNRAMDYRTDFYSLGASFYELLTGHPPFVSHDMAELLYHHIASPPPPFPDKTPIQTVEAIVMKLLSKSPEDRYQSAYGLKKDLETCLAAWNKNQVIPSFRLGKQDDRGQFQIPQKLYGREREIAHLMKVFDQVAGGQSQLMMVTGYSGIGKSALVNEIQKPIVKNHGYFVSGKFDQFKRDIPFSALIQAFQELIQQLLTEPHKKLTVWKNKILDAITPNAQLLIDVIPELELIIGKQPEIAPLPASESQNRFNTYFRKFVEVFSTQVHPLVIFLDDLQWADNASLDLIKLVITDPESHYLFLIGAYRNNEVHSAHPLKLTLDAILQHKGNSVSKNIETITLDNLSPHHITQMVCETLLQGESRVSPLVSLLVEKTSGNPFFVKEFLTSLYWQELLWFDFKKGQWVWDFPEIQKQNFTDNVVDLMIQKIQRLPKKTQTILKRAACIGNRFDLYILSIANEKPPEQTANELWSALEKGFIFPLENNYRYILNLKDFEVTQEGQTSYESHYTSQITYKFLHDRVQQAAYNLISEVEKKEIHLKIGQLLLAHQPKVDLVGDMTPIVNHMNIGLSLIHQKDKKVQLARLNLHVGQKAKQSTAYHSAIAYFKIGLQLLEGLLSQSSLEHGIPEESEQALQFNLTKEQAECEYLIGHFGHAETLMEMLLSLTPPRLQQGELYLLRTRYCVMNGKFNKAIELGIQGLACLNITVPIAPSEAMIAQESKAIETNMQGKTISDLAMLPRLTEPMKQLSLQILSPLYMSAYLTADFPLMSFGLLRMANIATKYGEVSGDSYSDYAIYLVAIKNYKDGYDFGKLALTMLPNGSRPNYIFGSVIAPWRMHLKHCLPYLHAAMKHGIANGDLTLARYAGIFLGFHMFFKGDPLSSVNEIVQKYFKFIEESGDPMSIGMIHLNQLWVDTLRNNPLPFDNTVFDETENHEKDNPAVHNVYYINKSEIAFLFGDYEAAFQAAIEAEKTLTGTSGYIMHVNRTMYYNLSALALISQGKQQKDVLWETLIQNQQQLKLWADNCSENFRAKYLLVSAEMAHMSGNVMKAMQLYESAIEQAKTHGYLQDTALANELAANFYLTNAIPTTAKTYLTEARYWYEHWGATMKVNQLDTKYPNLSPMPEADPHTTPSTTIDTLDLDLHSVLQSSQAISEEIELDGLLKKMTRVILENTGAQKGMLLFEKQSQWHIEAVIQYTQSTEGNDKVLQFIHSDALEPFVMFPKSLIHYVARTKNSVVLDNASQENRFTEDPYIQQTQPKSILCHPILHAGQFVRILYLENNLSTDVFTLDRLEVLKLLSGQAAISIENSKLYTSLQKHTIELQKTLKQLEKKNQTLQQTQMQLIQAEKAASTALIELQEAHTKQNEIIEQERLRIAQDLHDEAQQIFGAIYREYVHELSQTRQHDFSTEMQTGQKAIDAAINELYPPALQNLGLVAALEDYVSKLNKFKKMEIEFKSMVSPNLDKSIRVALFRLVQECLSNVIKHSGTREAEVIIQQPSSQLLWIQISDDGKGFDVETPSHRYGLAFMKERARQIGAKLDIQSEIGEGTTVICKLPL